MCVHARVLCVRVCVILPRRRFDLLLIQLLELAEGRLIRLLLLLVATAVSRLLASRHCNGRC